MMNIQTQKGFITPAIIALLVLAFVVGGALYFNSKPETESMKKDGEAMMEKEGEAMMEKTVTLALNAQNNSSEQGTAVLSDMNGKTKVMVSVNGAPTGTPQPMHIHMGSCPNPGAVLYPLTNLTNGVSETILDFPLSKILSELPLAINVHKSPTEAKIFVSCGDVVVSAMEKDGDTMMEKEGEAMMEDDAAMMKKEDGAMMAKYTGTVLAGSSAPLLEFNKADYDAAIASDKLVVLYFYANWCPICKEETQNSLYPAFNELTTDKVVGIRINYKDSDTDKDEENLARQFGVPYQHTKVFVKNGKQILKSPDGWDKARYITEIHKAITQ